MNNESEPYAFSVHIHDEHWSETVAKFLVTPLGINIDAWRCGYYNNDEDVMLGSISATWDDLFNFASSR